MIGKGDGLIILAKEHYDEILKHALSDIPFEACGLLAGEIKGGQKIVRAVYCLNNIDKCAEHFSMAPEEQFAAVKQMRQAGYVLLGNFHSHPSSPSRPSEEDIRLAYDSRLSYLIISLATEQPVLKSFNIVQGVVQEELISFA